MSGYSKRSLFTMVSDLRRSRASDESLEISRAAGRAEARERERFETLEPRVLLAGDHPSLIDFPNASEVTLDGTTGVGTIGGELEVVNDDDLFKFTAPATDFVTIRADGTNVARRNGDGTPLDTKIKVLDSTGAIIAESSGDGTVTGGTPTDAWFGFVATAGEEYFVNVLSDSDQADDGTGEYTLRVDGISNDLVTDDLTGEATTQENLDMFAVPSMFPLVEGSLGLDDPHTATPGDEFSGDDLVFSMTSLSGSFFDSLASVGALADVNDLDTRIEVFDANGEILVENSQAAFLNDPFVSFRSSPDTTFYVRVRSDEIGDPDTVNSAGEFGLKVDLAAEEIAIDPISRKGEAARPVRFQPPGLAPVNFPVLLNPSDFNIFRFRSHGFGQAFVTNIPVGIPHDLQLTILDFEGNQIAFVDDLIGTTPELRLELDGGEEYFVIVTGFDDMASGQHRLFVEAHHNVNISDDFSTDDHPNSHDIDGNLTLEERKRLFDNATPVNFGDPFATLDGDGNPVRDRGYRQAAFINGRIWDADPVDSNPNDNKDGIEEDTDLFQFVPPIDMLGEFAGDNDNAGTSLFVGGQFSGAELTTTPVPANSPGISVFDAFDWWAVGPRPTLMAPFGIQDNPDTPDSDGPVVHTLLETTLNLGTGLGPQPALVVGGDFNVVYPNPIGLPTIVQNLAVWAYNPGALPLRADEQGLTARYTWFDIGGTDGTVRALAEFTPTESFDSNGDGANNIMLQPPQLGPFLVVGGEFTTIGAAGATGLAQFNINNLANPGAMWEGFAGIDGPVFALETYDPLNPGDGREAPTTDITLDVVVVNRDTPQFSIAALANEDGTGINLTEPEAFGEGLITPNVVVAADFLGAPDGGADEAVDIAVLDPVLRQVTVFQNTADGNLPPTDLGAMTLGLPSSQTPRDMIAADVFGSALPDILVVSSGTNSDTGRLVVLENLGNGNFAAPVTFTLNTLQDSILSIDAGDLIDADGINDLAIADSARDLVYVGQNTSGGGVNFTFTEVTINASSTPVGVAIGDLDGDDVPDIATANQGSNTVKALFNNGDGTFDNTTTPFLAGGNDPSGIQIAPMRAGDTANDIIVVNEASSSVSILTSQSGYTQRNTFATNPDGLNDAPADLAIGDMNGDGRLDVVTVNTNTDTVSVLLGTGAQTLTTPAQRFVTGEDTVDDRPIGLALVDLDVEIGSVLLEVPNPPDPPNSLFIGGSFTLPVETFFDTTIIARNIASWDGDSFRPASFGSSEVDDDNPDPVIPPSETDGPVFALQVHNPSFRTLDGDIEQLGPILYVGGEFTMAGGVAANNIARMGLVDPNQDPETPGYAPQLLWEDIGGTNGPVYALANWLPPEIEGQPDDPFEVIVVGGEFTTAAGGEAFNIAMQSLGAFGPMGINLPIGSVETNLNAPVRALMAVDEVQEPGLQVIANEAAADDRQVIYAGGDFTNLGTPDDPGLPAGRLAYFDVVNTIVGPAFTLRPTREGADDSVFALAAFDDNNPTVDNSASKWDRHDRPATRATLVVSPGADSFANMFVTIYDSDLNVVYSNDDRILTDIPPDPAGGWDPTLRTPQFVQQFQQLILPPMNGGETYYLEVSSLNGTGTYSMSIVVDALPPDNDGSGVLRDINATIFEVGGDFTTATGLSPDQNGEDVNFNASSTPPFAAHEQKLFKPSPSLRGSISHSYDFGTIFSVDDEDYFAFTAQTTGTVEVRLSTISTPDEFAELVGNTVISSRTDTFDSLFDGAIRVFNNDLEQLAYNNDNDVTRGDTISHNTGTLPATDFRETDPRVLFNVVEGERYFLVIESGQRYAIGAPEEPGDRVENTDLEVDKRRATGTYRLLLNSPSTQTTLNGAHLGDDHMSNAAGFGATPVTLDEFGNSALGLFINDNGTPSDESDDFNYDGRIGNASGGFGFEIDAFEYTAPGDGTITVTVDHAINSPSLISRITVTDQSAEILADGSATSETPAQITLPVTLGEKLNFVISSLGGTTGEYTLDVSGPSKFDDFADEGQWALAQPIRLFDFLGSGDMDGSVERAGDSDIFSFQAFDFQQMRIRVDSANNTVFNPRLRVFEIQEDAVGTPYRVLIAQSDDTDSNGDGNLDSTSSEVLVSVNTDRTGLVTGNTYNDYFIVVDGSDVDTSVGDYTVSIEFPETDDHADRPDFVDEDTRDLSTLVVIDSTTGQGSDTGVIEKNTDSDVFTFIAPASGSSALSITAQFGSTLEGQVTVFDADLNVLATFDGDLPGNVLFDVERGRQYFVIVEPSDSAGDGFDTGGYSLSIDGPAIDDHPNVGEFDLATVIPLNANTGDGNVGTGVQGGNNPTLNPTRDTDLFRFTTIADGEVVITLNPVGNFATLRPKLTVFDADENVIETVSTTEQGESVSITLDDTVRSERFFILVEDALGVAPPASEYSLIVDGPAGQIDPPDDPSIIDFDTPVNVPLDIRGDAQRSDLINVIGDRDLFTFVAPSAGRSFVQVTTPNGSLLDASITILDAADEDAVVVFDAGGIPGASANAQFQAIAGQRYYAIVDGLGNGTGSYTLRLNLVAPPVRTGIDEVDALGFTNRLFYPEGFANNRISEFVSIANPNDTAARFSVILRYEVGERDAVIVNNATIEAGARSGLTLTDPRVGQLEGVRKNSPYSIEVVSDIPVGATLSHYDFDISTGEAFTESTSDEWIFARVERVPGVVNDFIVFYNPNPFSVDVTLSATAANGQTVEITKTVGANRRGGWSINNTVELPTGIFGVELSSQATNPANDAEFIGIVAALSHFDIDGESGFGVLGDGVGGAKAGVITSLERSNAVTSEIAIYNPRNTLATIDLTGQYIRADLPDLQRRISVPGNSVVILSGAQLGMINSQPIGITYSANRRISVVVSEEQFGDANGVTAASEAGTEFFYGDAFIGRKRAGELYFETLNFYNPSGQAIDIEVELFYVNGESDLVTVLVGANGFSELILHELDQSLNNPDRTNAFSIETRSASPFVSTLTHFDLFLGGGWSMVGAPAGLLNSLDTII